MEIKEGMYVRIKANNVTYIRQIIEVCKDIRYATYKVDKPFCNQTGLSPKKIIKASFNIIDLIEVGDYVNGEKVDFKNEFEDDYYIKGYGGNGFEIDFEHQEDIETIVTKEQFEGMQYKVGE